MVTRSWSELTAEIPGKRRKEDVHVSPFTQRVGALAAGAVIAGGTLLGPAPASPSITAVPNVVQHDIALVDIPTPFGTILVPWPNPTLYPDFAQMERFILDAWLGIGPQTLPQFMDPNGTTPLQDLFTGWNGLVGTNFQLGGAAPSNMNYVFDSMGLNNINVEAILTALGLQPGDTVADMLSNMGLDNVTLDEVLTGFGADHTTTLATLIDDWGAGSWTVQQLLGMILPQNTTTMGDLFIALGIGGLRGFLPLLGSSNTQTVDAFLNLLGLNPTTVTLHDLLNDPTGTPTSSWDGMFSTIGGMTLGQLMGFNDTTTLSAVLNGMLFNLGGTPTPLGDFTLTELLGQLQITPNESLAEVLGSLPLGTGGASDLGTTTLADFLGVFAGGMPIDETTTITAFLTGAGLDTQSIDELLGVGDADISNWFIPI